MNELALFAGAGGGILGGKLLGWRTVCAVEWEPYPASVLCARQNDGLLTPFPIWDDIQTFDGRPWRGIVDVVSGGFPCQDISAAGKGKGIIGEKSSLWFQMLRIIKEVKPKYCFIENSPNLRTKGLNTVLKGLANSGYNAAWGVLSAKDCGANHERKRIWIVGKTTDPECFGLHTEKNEHIMEESRKNKLCIEQSRNNWNLWWKTESGVDRMVDGLASRVDRLKTTGNGQVPSVAATAWQQLVRCLDEK
jgi:DNA (cytosine-5)-methyltransferase 1